ISAGKLQSKIITRFAWFGGREKTRFGSKRRKNRQVRGQSPSSPVPGGSNSAGIDQIGSRLGLFSNRWRQIATDLIVKRRSVVGRAKDRCGKSNFHEHRGRSGLDRSAGKNRLSAVDSIVDPVSRGRKARRLGRRHCRRQHEGAVATAELRREKSSRD